MNRYRPPTRSRAAPDTLCQKCLKRGHFSYECNAKAQERPYAARPSRTQQLFNPKLVPELDSEVPNDLLRKKGVADEILAKSKEEQSRKRGRDNDHGGRRSRKRSRSSSRASSVSTISTNRFPSPSPKRRSHAVPRHHTRSPARHERSTRHTDRTNGKRRRSPSTSPVESTGSRMSDIQGARDTDRNTRRRMSSFSPADRGRRKLRSPVEDRMRSVSRSVSPSRSRSRSARRRRSHSNNRRRRRSHRRSPSPARHRSPSPVYANGSRQTEAPPIRAPPPAPPRRPSPPRERSLSPFSKRVAMTRQMNQGPPVQAQDGGMGRFGDGAPPPWR